MSESAIASGVGEQAQGWPWTRLTDIVLTRPNDATAYVAGDVFGAAGDVRFQVPSLGVAGKYINQLRVDLVRNRPSTDAGPNVGLYFFSAQPATVQGDNAPIALSDADIALLVPVGNTHLLQFSNVSGPLNMAASPNGRSYVARASAIAFASASVAAALTTCWCIPILTAAYAPLANETFTFTFWVQRIPAAA